MQSESERIPLVSDSRWKLRLFLSVDVVGSTAYKSSFSNLKVQSVASEWAPVFRNFFRDFPSAVRYQYSQVDQNFFVGCKNQIEVWKFAGDEILMSVELHDFREVSTHLYVFKEVVKLFPQQWAEKKIPLRLKGTAWLAGFPVTNVEARLTIDEKLEIVDFIGPSVDLGFRLTKFADTKRFPLSADLALMLLEAIETKRIPSDHFRLCYHGRESLKGIIGNDPYPVVWIDLTEGKQSREEELLGVATISEHSKLKDFLASVFADDNSQLRSPFIAGDSDDRYGTIAPEMELLRQQMEAEGSSRTFTTNPQSEPPSLETADALRKVEEPSDLLKPRDQN